MEILLQFLLLALGFVMLGKGADWFVEGAAALATRFGIPQRHFDAAWHLLWCDLWR